MAVTNRSSERKTDLHRDRAPARITDAADTRLTGGVRVTPELILGAVARKPQSSLFVTPETSDDELDAFLSDAEETH